MDLSRNVIKEFAEITRTEDKTSSAGLTTYGTIVSSEESLYVRLDGSEQVTPVSFTTDAKEGDRVVVMVKNHEATVLGSTTSPSARVEHVQEVDNYVKEVDEHVKEVDKNKVDTKYLEANYATVDQLDAKYATIEHLQADYADIDHLHADYATIDMLEAKYGEINTLKADVADIDKLIFGSASGNVIQSEFSNAVVGQISDAQIKSAMILSLEASKINAGTINTTNVTLKSDDGLLSIADETIQIKDETRVRVQIGKDASNDYSINVWDANGELMFSQGGITEHAVKSAIIRNDMVSEEANISAGKLDISSLFTEINDAGDGTITSNKILIDTDTGTLDVAFKNMTTTVNNMSETVTSQGTALTIVEGKIDSKVWQQDETLAKATDVRTLTTQYTNLTQTVSGISSTVNSHTTELKDKADSSTVTEVRTDLTTLEQDYDDFKTSVSSTYQKKDEMTGYVTTSQMETAIEQSAEGITSTVESTYTTSETTGEIIEDMETVLGDGTEENPGLIEELRTDINQTDQEWRLSVEATNANVSAVDDKVTGVQDTVNSYSTWFNMDEDGLTIGKIEDGEELPLKVKLDNDSLDFMDGDRVVAYISNEKLMIDAAEIEGVLDIGNFRWVSRGAGNRLGLMWIGG